MTAVATGYTLILGETNSAAAPTYDFIVTDAGVLYSTDDGGTTWRCFGLADPRALLLDLGVERCNEIIDVDAPDSASKRRFVASSYRARR